MRNADGHKARPCKASTVVQRAGRWFNGQGRWFNGQGRWFNGQGRALCPSASNVDEAWYA